EVRLQWLDEASVFRDSPTASQTDDKGGFAAVVRLSAVDDPKLDPQPHGPLTVRLRARRGGNQRGSLGVKLPHGPGPELTLCLGRAAAMKETNAMTDYKCPPPKYPAKQPPDPPKPGSQCDKLPDTSCPELRKPAACPPDPVHKCYCPRGPDETTRHCLEDLI